MTGFIAFAVVVSIAMLYAKSRKANVSMVDNIAGALNIKTKRHFYLVHSDIVQFARQSNINIDIVEVSYNSIKIVLSSDVTIFSFGFFYPILIHKGNDDMLEINIGIIGRLFQHSPAVKRQHKKIYDKLTVMLSDKNSDNKFNEVIKSVYDSINNAMVDNYSNETGELQVAVAQLTSVVQKMFADNKINIFSDLAKNIVCEAIVSGKFATEEEVMQA